MDDSFLFEWLNSAEDSSSSKEKNEPILSEKLAGPDLSKIRPEDFQHIFKEDSELNENERVAKSALRDYMMLIHVIRTAAKSTDSSKLMMVALTPDQLKKVVEAITDKYGISDEVSMSLTSQMIMTTMMISVIGTKYNVPPTP